MPGSMPRALSARGFSPLVAVRAGLRCIFAFSRSSASEADPEPVDLVQHYIGVSGQFDCLSNLTALCYHLLFSFRICLCGRRHSIRPVGTDSETEGSRCKTLSEYCWRG